LLKNLSADATVAGIVNNILKPIQRFGNNSHGPHGGDHFKALSKYRKWLVSPVYFEIFGFLGMSANPKLTFASTLYQLVAQVQQSAKCTAHLRCALLALAFCTAVTC